MEVGDLTVGWSVTTAPGEVGFDPADALATHVTVDQPGRHDLQVSVDNGLFVTTRAVEVLAVGPPTAAASGPDIVATTIGAEPVVVDLVGEVQADGRGGDAPTRDGLDLRWEVVEAPPGVEAEGGVDAAGGEIEIGKSTGWPRTTTPVTLPGSGSFQLRFVVDNGHHRVEVPVTVVVNMAPVVDAGPARLITVGRSVLLDGNVGDDGHPARPGRLTLAWRNDDMAAGAVELESEADDLARATARAAGIHPVTFEATDGVTTVDDTTTLLATDQPVVSAGADLMVPATGPGPFEATLTATIDTGSLPPSQITGSEWLQVAGPGPARVVGTGDLTAEVVLPEMGSYRFRFLAWLTVDGVDRRVIGSDEVVVAASSRVVDDLELLYRFEDEPAGSHRAVGSSAAGLELIVPDGAPVGRPAGSSTGLSLTGPTLVASTGAARRLVERLGGADALTLEAWVTPREVGLSEGAPARIVTLSADHEQRNLTLGQTAAGYYEVRLRNTGTEANGSVRGVLSSAMPGGAGGRVRAGGLTHIVFTWSQAIGGASLYLDGVEVASRPMPGTLLAAPGSGELGWDASYRLAIGDEIVGQRAWLGDYHLVAVYRRALSPQEVLRNHLAG